MCHNSKFIIGASIVVFSLIILYSYELLTIHINAKAEVLEAHDIYDFIWMKIPDHAKVKLYVSAINDMNIIDVYGLTDEPVQEKIIYDLSSKIISTHWKPTIITFYVSENWIDQGYRRTRGKEKIIKTRMFK